MNHQSVNDNGLMTGRQNFLISRRFLDFSQLSAQAPAVHCSFSLQGLIWLLRLVVAQVIFKMTKVKRIILSVTWGAIFTVNASAQVFPSGMISYWKFNDNLNDELGTYPASMGPSGGFAGGLINQGLQGGMVCSDSFAAKTADNFPNLESFTVEAWIKPACPPSSWQGSLSVAKWANGYAGPGFILYADPTPYGSSNYKFRFFLSDASNYLAEDSPSTYSCGNWYHVTGIRDKGNSSKLFVNGEEVRTAHDDLGSIGNTQPLTFHGVIQGCGWGLSGETLDEVAIYNRVLSEPEIRQHYRGGLQGRGYEATEVTIDIKPGSNVNSINPNSKGRIAVAVLSTATFDATQLDVNKVHFGTATVAHSTIEDVNGDGLYDIVLYFKIENIGITCGSNSVTLIGDTLDGQLFHGSDSIKIVGRCK